MTSDEVGEIMQAATHNKQTTIELQFPELFAKIQSLQEENYHLRDLLMTYEEDGAYGESCYVGSMFSNRFHRPTCEWAQEINPLNLLTWPSHEAAVRDGRKPCGTCRA